MIRGLDVSACQGRVDWAAVRALGCAFAYVKCTEGNKGLDPVLGQAEFYCDRRRASGFAGVDPLFDVNVARARAAGLLVAPYHFAYPLPTVAGKPMRDPEQQAKFAYDGAAGLGSFQGDLPPMLDLEWPMPNKLADWGCTEKQVRTWSLDCADAMAGYFGCDPIIYTYPDWAGALGLATEPAFRRYRLMVASYPTPAAWPAAVGARPLARLGPWGDDWTFWQITGGKMTLPGGTPADFQVFNGDADALAALCRRS